MKKTMLLAVLLMLGLAAGAFAQPPPQGAVFQGATENVTLVVESGHTELTGDVYMTVIGTLPTLAGTITLKYNVPFTSPLDPLMIGAPVIFGTGGLAAVAVDQGASDAPAGRLVLIVPAGGLPADYIQVHGVRLDVAGSPKPQYTVTLSSTKNAIFNGQFTAPVIDGAAAGLKLDETVPVELNAINPVGGDAYIYLLEGFNNAFGVTNLTDPTQTISQMIRIRLSAAPPEGVTIRFPAIATSLGASAQWTRASAAGTVLGTSRTIDFESEDLDIYYRLTSDNNPTLPESFAVEDIYVDASDAVLPLPNGVITYTATLAVVEAAFDADGEVTDLPIPRYAEALIHGGELVIIKGRQTALLAPLAQNMPSIGYDTGLAIANTTTDPGDLLMGIDADAIKQTGKITFYMYQQQKGSAVPKLFTYTTGAASPGTGLDASGNLASGSTYTVLVSQLLEAAGITEEFQGYIIAITQFTNAHGLYVCSNFQTFSQGSSMVVIKSDRQDVPESLGQ
jgi:hypothetical protein